jgi:hypothetical protein
VLAAREVAKWTNRFAVTRDGRLVTTLDTVQRDNFPGSFTLDGHHYTLPGSIWDSRLSLVDERGDVVARASRTSHGWTLAADQRTYYLRGAFLWGLSQQFEAGDPPIGTVRRTGRWQRGVDLDLPGVPTVLQIFLLAVNIASWDRWSLVWMTGR